MYVIAILLLATRVAAYQQRGKNTALRVYDGDDDTTGKYPYVVALVKHNGTTTGRLCTGSIIKDTWVLSAAHCLVPLLNYIQYGNMSTPMEHTKSKSAVLKKISHPSFLLKHAMYTYSDVALLMVERVNTMSKYARISAVDYRTFVGLPVEYAGFGTTYYSTKNTHDNKRLRNEEIYRPLQIFEAVLTPCDEFPHRKNWICVRAKCSRSKQMVLNGDSGGPLMLDNKIVGLAFGLFPVSYEQVFTPVSPHLSWINSVIKSHQQLTTRLNKQ